MSEYGELEEKRGGKVIASWLIILAIIGALIFGAVTYWDQITDFFGGNQDEQSEEQAEDGDSQDEDEPIDGEQDSSDQPNNSSQPSEDSEDDPFVPGADDQGQEPEEESPTEDNQETEDQEPIAEEATENDPFVPGADDELITEPNEDEQQEEEQNQNPQAPAEPLEPEIDFGDTDPDEEPDEENADSDEDQVIGEIVDGPADTTPPENVSDLLITFEERVRDFLVELDWEPSLNSAGDLVEQIVYFSDNQGQTWEQEAIGSSKTAHQLIAEPESELTVKITTQDAAGNESAGVIKTVIIPALTSTGPVALGLVGLSSISAYFYRSQKRRKTKSEKFLD